VVVNAGDAKAMAEGINKLIEDKELREELGHRARKRVEENYTIEKAVNQIEGIYRSLAKEGKT